MSYLRLSLLSLMFIATPSFAGSDLDAAANDVCGCLAEPYAHFEKTMQRLQEAQASGDSSKMTAAQGEMMQILQVSTQCFEGLSKKYPDISQSDELKGQVMAKAEQQCPNPGAQMGVQVQ